MVLATKKSPRKTHSDTNQANQQSRLFTSPNPWPSVRPNSTTRLTPHKRYRSSYRNNSAHGDQRQRPTITPHPYSLYVTSCL